MEPPLAVARVLHHGGGVRRSACLRLFGTGRQRMALEPNGTTQNTSAVLRAALVVSNAVCCTGAELGQVVCRQVVWVFWQWRFHHL